MAIEAIAHRSADVGRAELCRQKALGAFRDENFVDVFCDGIRRQVNLSLLGEMLHATGCTANATDTRIIVRCVLRYCLSDGHLSQDELDTWEQRSKDPRAMQGHAAWVRENLMQLGVCACDPYLDALVRSFDQGRLSACVIPWPVVVQAMRLLDDGDWTIDRCKREARFRTTTKQRRQRPFAARQAALEVIPIAERIVHVQKGSGEDVARYLQELIDQYCAAQDTLTTVQYRILRRLTTILRTRISHGDTKAWETHYPLVKRAEALLDPDGPRGVSEKQGEGEA